MRVSLRVRPGARRTEVGGSFDGALVVRVAARAENGRATEAALVALASALDVRRRDVSLVTGATHRTKLVEIPDGSARAFRGLLHGADPDRGSDVDGTTSSTTDEYT